MTIWNQPSRAIFSILLPRCFTPKWWQSCRARSVPNWSLCCFVATKRSDGKNHSIRKLTWNPKQRSCQEVDAASGQNKDLRSAGCCVKCLICPSAFKHPQPEPILYNFVCVFWLLSGPSFQDEVMIAAHQQTMLELGLASEPKKCGLQAQWWGFEPSKKALKVRLELL